MLYNIKLCCLIFLLCGSACFAAAEETEQTSPPVSVENSLPSKTGGRVFLNLPLDTHGKMWVEWTPFAASDEHQTVFFANAQQQSTLSRAIPGHGVLCLGGEAYATHCRRFEMEPPRTIELQPSKGTHLKGRFIQDAEAVQARVSLTPADLSLPFTFTLPLKYEARGLKRLVEAGANGTFLVPRLAAGRYFLEAELATGRIYRSEEIIVPAAEDLRKNDKEEEAIFDLGEIVIEIGPRLDFIVADHNGETISGATVAYSQVIRPLEFKSFKSETDQDGKAHVMGVDLELSGNSLCRAAGYREHRQEFETPPPLVECFLEPLALLEGRAVDLERRPVAPSTVTLTAAVKTPGTSRRQSSTPTDGAFSFKELPAEEYVLQVAAAGFEVEKIKMALEPGENLNLGEIALRPGREVHGVVVDEDSEEPIFQATVQVIDPPGAGSANTDQDGEFRLITGSDDGLSLRVGAEGYATRKLEIHSDQAFDQEEPLNISLSAGGSLHIRVFNEETREPCQQCRVGVHPNNSGTHRLSTDTAGEVLLTTLQPGTYTVNVPQVRTRGSLITVSAGNHTKNARVQAHKTTTVTFGESTEPLKIHFDPPLPPGWNLDHRGLSVGLSWREPDGGFVVKRRPGELLEISIAEAVEGIGRTIWQAIIPADFEDNHLQLPLWDTLVDGTLINHEGQPLQHLPVALVSLVDSQPKAQGYSNNDGYFALPFIHPGNYALQVVNQPIRYLTVSANRPTKLEEIQLSEPE